MTAQEQRNKSVVQRDLWLEELEIGMILICTDLDAQSPKLTTCCLLC